MRIDVFLFYDRSTVTASHLALPFNHLSNVHGPVSPPRIPATYNGTRDDVKPNENKIVVIFLQLLLSSYCRPSARAPKQYMYTETYRRLISLP